MSDDRILTDEELARALCNALDRCRRCEWAFKPDDPSVVQSHWTGQWVKKRACREPRGIRRNGATDMRVFGHTLRNEGAAYRGGEQPNQRNALRVAWNTTEGEGFALCSCGARSPVLMTGQERKNWHRDHKQRVVDGWRQGVGH